MIETDERPVKELIEKKNQQLIAQALSYMGPIPHSSEMAKYENILPGSAHRILLMAENQSTHRQQLENRDLDSKIAHSIKESKRTDRGQWMGYSIAMICIILGAILGLLHNVLASVIIATLGPGSVITTLIYNNKNSKK